MFKGALALALGLLTVCSSVVAQQAKHSGVAQHRVAGMPVKPLDAASNLSIYRPNLINAHDSILFHNGPVRAWSDGAQLVSQDAFVQIGMAPLGLFPLAYLAPSDTGPMPARRPGTALGSQSPNLPVDEKDLPAQMFDSPLSQVYVTGEIGFMYGQWSGKGSGDYVGSYIWGQAGNDKLRITAGGSFENWNGSGPKFRSFNFAR